MRNPLKAIYRFRDATLATEKRKISVTRSRICTGVGASRRTGWTLLAFAGRAPTRTGISYTFLAGCRTTCTDRSLRMACLHFLADQPVQNHQQQDCRLVVEVHAPEGADNQWIQGVAENAIKQTFDNHLTLKPISQQAAARYLRDDSHPDHGSLNLTRGIPLLWHLVRIV